MITPARCRDAVLLHGVVAGWIAILLLAGADVVHWSVLDPPQGIISACARSGYPKQADYAWYGAMLVGGLTGAGVGVLVTRILRNRLRPRAWPVPVAWTCLAAAAVLGTRMAEPSSWPAWGFLVAGWVLPWTDGVFAGPAAGREPEPGVESTLPVPGRWWAAASTAVAVAWIYDSCMAFRPIDGLHEGGQLIYVQSWLAGDRPGLETRIQYGVLYAHSLAWWTAAFGPTMSAARGYFLGAQMAGTAIHLWLLRATLRRGWSLATGAWLMLTLSTAPNIQFGWGNALRTALPLLAMWLVWRRRDGLAGALAAVGWLYSQEYGLAGAFGGVLIVALAPGGSGWREHGHRAAAWAAGAVTATAGMLVLMFGWGAAAAAAQLGGGGYALARLLGHAVSPLPAFPWWESWPGFLAQGRVLLDLLAIWGAGGLVVAVVVRMPRWRRRSPERSAWLGGMAAFTLLAQIPVVARPLWQIAAATPAAILLGVAAADMLLAESRSARWAGRAALVASAAYAVAVVAPMVRPLASKAACVGLAPTSRTVPGLERLGTVRVTGAEARDLAALVSAIRALTPAGSRVYLAAPRYAYACFLADRAALPPFALTYLAATRKEREATVAALERASPPLAVVTDAGLDLPFAEEHPEEHRWLMLKYRLARRIGEVQLWVPRRPGAPTTAR